MKRTTALFLAGLMSAAGIAAAAETPSRLPEAIAMQRQLTGDRPADATAFNDLGNLLDLAGDVDGAEEAYVRALELDPEFAPAHYNLGLLLRGQGRSRAALDEFQEVVKLDPEDAWGHYQLGTLLEQRGRKTKATRHFARAFLLDPHLLELEHNPQLLDSRLTMRASLTAYIELVDQLEGAPRKYEQPDRISALLVPAAVKAEPEPEAEPAPEAAPAKPQAGAAEEGEEVKKPAPRRARPRRQPRKPPSGDDDN